MFADVLLAIVQSPFHYLGPKFPPPLLLLATPPLVGMTEMLLPVSATEDVVEVAGAEVALVPPLPRPNGANTFTIWMKNSIAIMMTMMIVLLFLN